RRRRSPGDNGAPSLAHMYPGLAERGIPAFSVPWICTARMVKALLALRKAQHLREIAMGQVQALPRNGEAGTALGTNQADFEHVSDKASADFEDFFENGAIALHLVGADGTILRA